MVISSFLDFKKAVEGKHNFPRQNDLFLFKIPTGLIRLVNNKSKISYTVVSKTNTNSSYEKHFLIK